MRSPGIYVGSVDAAAELNRPVGADAAAVYNSQNGHMLFVLQATLAFKLLR